MLRRSTVHCETKKLKEAVDQIIVCILASDVHLPFFYPTTNRKFILNDRSHSQSVVKAVQPQSVYRRHQTQGGEERKSGGYHVTPSRCLHKHCVVLRGEYAILLYFQL